MSTKTTAETTAPLRGRIQETLKAQRQPTVTVLSSLLAIQSELHYLPVEAIEETAEFLHTTVNEVWSVASFYANFRFTPPGKHVVEVCWGPACHLVGAQRVLKAVQDELGLEGEGETDDGEFSLKLETCLGPCALAPVIAIDHHHKGRMTSERAVQELKERKSS